MALFSYINHCDRSGVTFTPGSEVASMPASNLAEPQVHKIWRTQNANETITIDFGADRNVDIVALVFQRRTGLAALDLAPDFAAGDTVRHQLYDSGNGLLYDSGVIASNVNPSVGYHVLNVLADNGSAVTGVRKWTITFVGTSRAGDGYFDVGRAWAGELYQPSANYTFNPTFTWEDPSDKSRAARSSATYVDRSEPYRMWSVNFNSLKEIDEAEFEEMERMVGVASQFLFCRKDTGDLHDQTILCLNERTLGISQSNVSRYAKSFRFIESL